MKYTIVKASKLGTNCWLSQRFLEGGRCPRVMECNYPEKQTCKALDTEIAYQKERLAKTVKRTKTKVFQLERERAGIS